jgi:hypothetical protein
MSTAERERSKQRRARNRETSTKLLADNNIPFQASNNGAHLIVSTKHGFIDFWPGTGKWITRQPPYLTRRGVFLLINYCKQELAA